MARPGETSPMILMNDAALALPPELAGPLDGARLVVAGMSRVRLTLATLALPEATMIWTDFGQSASLSALGARVRALGRLDRLVLAGDGRDSAAIFAMMQTILTFLPVLGQGRGQSIVLVVRKGPALASLTAFLQRLRPSCDCRGIRLVLRVRGDDGLADPAAPVGTASHHGMVVH